MHVQEETVCVDCLCIHVQVAPFATVVEVCAKASECVGKLNVKRSRKSVKESLNLDEDTTGEVGSESIPTKKRRRNYSKAEFYERLMAGVEGFECGVLFVCAKAKKKGINVLIEQGFST